MREKKEEKVSSKGEWGLSHGRGMCGVNEYSLNGRRGFGLPWLDNIG